MQSGVTGAPAIKAIDWMNWADQDYIAARGLLLTGFLVQGNAFSNTAIEKYLKGILTIRSLAVPRTHDVVKLYESAKNNGGVPPLNQGYLRVLVKSYRLRYPDDLEPGFNISLAQFPLLAELDATVHSIRKGFAFHKANGSIVETRFDLLLKIKDLRLTDRNAAFSPFDRADLFANGSECYEFRVLPTGATLEATYRADVKDGINFEAEGLKPGAA